MGNPFTKSLSRCGLCRVGIYVVGGKCNSWGYHVGHCVFNGVVKDGVAIHEAFLYCEKMSEYHLFNMKEICCVYLFGIMNDQVCACG